MSDFDKNMQEALGGGAGFDPDRALAAQEEVFQTYQEKLKRYERVMWLKLYLLLAVCMYAIQGFMIHATTTKEWIGYSLAILFVGFGTLQRILLHGITATQLVAMMEIKRLRLALAGGAALQDEAAVKPLRGISRGEKIRWLCGLVFLAWIVGGLSAWTNTQNDFWRLKAQGRIEAHSVLTLRRLPHEIRPLYSLTGPVEGAVLQSATLNGQPVSFDTFRTQYTIQLPCRLSWKSDKVELVWSFPLSALRDGADFRAPLRSIIPVHYYSLTFYVEDDSGYVGTDNAWKFNKSPEQLKNEAEARRTLMPFRGGGRDGAPRDNYGSCGLPIVPHPAR